MIVLILRLGSSAKLGSITDFMYDISPVLFSGDREEEVERFKKKKKDKTLKIYYVYSWFCYFLPSSTLLLSRR